MCSYFQIYLSGDGLKLVPLNPSDLCESSQ